MSSEEPIQLTDAPTAKEAVTLTINFEDDDSDEKNESNLNDGTPRSLSAFSP